MRKKSLILLCLLFSFFINSTITAQENKKELITKTLTDYFLLERENIHVQSNKNVYMTNEQIWFKGYVFHRKKNMPFFTTVNVYMNLLDETGNIVQSQLLYANIGSFSGNIKLNDSLKSGKYYLQFYTNWMNNFVEDESAVYEISIINTTLGAGTALAGPDLSEINIDLHPEGGTMLSETANVIGISISDCNRNPIAIKTADITDAAGKILQTIQINKLGFGRVTLAAGNYSGYKAVVMLNNVKYEQTLPQEQIKGIALEVNNFSVANKTIVTLSTNKLTAASFNSKPLYIVVHKDDDATVYEVNFNSSLVTKVAIDNTDLQDGLNTLRILDSDLNQLAERLIYKYPATTLNSEINLTTQTTEKLEYEGKINYGNMNVSISVLPENTRSYDEANDIFGSLLLLPYIETPKKATGKHYFSTLTKGKSYELDLFLLSQKSKYTWHNIRTNVPKSNFPFDMGLTLKGIVPKQLGPNQFSKVRLSSITSAIDETVTVKDNGEFIFDNILIPDSTYVNFTVLNKEQKPKGFTLAPQLLNNNKKFNKRYTPATRCFTSASETASNIKAPDVYKESIELEEVTIEGKKMKYATVSGNGNLRGYKITQKEINSYSTVLNFIKLNSSFVVNDNSVDVTIYSTRSTTSLNAAPPTPIIYLDNMQVMDHSILRSISMYEIDEIYMNPHAIVPSVRNFMGVIKIYINRNYKPKTKDNVPEILVKNGYKRMVPFENILYTATDNEGFANFGVIDWEPVIMTDENGRFKFDIPKTGQKSIKLLIEGFSADGKLLSETKVINVN